VTTVPAYKSATDKTVVASVPTRPSTDNTGTLVDNKNGTYTYSFYRDITKAKDAVAAATLTAPNVAADLGDLTYDPTLVHRLTIQISGNAPGTGSNTPDGTTVTAAVPMTNPINVIYDFIPATGKAVTATDPSREIVATAKCNECHDKLGNTPGATKLVNGVAVDATIHGGARKDTRYCVMCHTDQRKYGRTEATTTATGYSGSTYLINGISIANLPTFIHKIHFGEELTKTGYNLGGVLFNEVKFPQDIRNCTKCHDGSATSTAKTANGDNWKSVPSRLACGACHDGINFATGKGTTLAGSTIGHIGGAKADDSQCVLCHDATTIPTYHIPVTPPDPGNALNTAGGNTHSYSESIDGNQNNLPEGAIKITWDLQSVSRNASKQPVMVFRLLQNGARADFNTYSATGKTEIWDNFFGSPSLYFVFAVPQDGITAPADFNASVSSYLRSVWNGSATGTSKGTLTGPDASGYYTATLTGVTVPDNAVMLTGGIGYTYGSGSQPLTQMNVSGYPVTASPVDATKNVGGLAVVAPNVAKVATGYTGRRAVVENARCNKCHENLGVFTAVAFHSGQRNDAPTCSWCHNPNRTSSGWSADSEVFVHAIHGASKRGVAFTWAAGSATDNFSTVGYPGILKNCETCHLPGTYDFSASASASAMPNRLYRTAATGTTAAATFSTSPYIAQTAGTAYGSGFSFAAATGVTTAAAGTTLVNSPIAAACFACHDSDLAKSHMTSNGGSLYEVRTTALAKTEQCTLCHLAGKVADIKTMHAK
jgi:OmcA/MtrC family decaheme c-type cytochrome